jgi:hypothetical protein
MDNLGNLALVVIALVLTGSLCCAPLALLPVMAAVIWWSARQIN